MLYPSLPRRAAVLICRDNQQPQGTAPASNAAALHRQRLEQQHSQKGQHEQEQGTLSLPGRIESSTAPAPPPLLKELPEVVDLPPMRKDPAKTAGDAEFDYDKELQRGAASGSGGAQQQNVMHTCWASWHATSNSLCCQHCCAQQSCNSATSVSATADHVQA